MISLNVFEDLFHSSFNVFEDLFHCKIWRQVITLFNNTKFSNDILEQKYYVILNRQKKNIMLFSLELYMILAF